MSDHRRTVREGRTRAAHPALVIAGLAPVKGVSKAESWVHYWDDPAHVSQAFTVGIGAVVFLALLLIIGWVSGVKEKQRKARARRRRLAAEKDY